MKYKNRIIVLSLIVLLFIYGINQFNSQSTPKITPMTDTSEENIIDIKERSNIEKITIDPFQQINTNQVPIGQVLQNQSL